MPLVDPIQECNVKEKSGVEGEVDTLTNAENYTTALFDGENCHLPARDKAFALVSYAKVHLAYHEVDGWFGNALPNPNPNITEWLRYAIHLNESVSLQIAEVVDSQDFYHIAIEQSKVAETEGVQRSLEWISDITAGENMKL